MSKNHIFLFVSFLASICTGDIILETERDIEGWEISSCVYAEKFEDESFQDCRVEAIGMNGGLWSFCKSLEHCRMTYTMAGDAGVVTAIQIRAYIMKKSSNPSPEIRITYSNADSVFKTQYYPAQEDGWRTIDYSFEENVFPNAVSIRYIFQL